MNQQQASRKPTPIETAEAVLGLLNKMNVSTGQVLAELANEFPTSSDAFIRMEGQLSVVLNGITSLTTIYQEALKRAQAAEDTSQRNLSELSALPTERGQAVRDLSVQRPSARLSNSAIEQATSVLQDTTRRVGEIAERISAHGAPRPTPAPSTTDVLRETTLDGQTALDKLLGDDGVLMKYLSPHHHHCGKGNIRISQKLGAYVENIQSIPVADLSYYPQGFYDTKTAGPQELYLKTGDMEFLWIFGGEPRQCYMRRDGAWINAQTLSRTTLSMFITRIETHLLDLSASL